MSVTLWLCLGMPSPGSTQEESMEQGVLVEGGTETVRPAPSENPPLRGGGQQPGARTVIELSKYASSQQSVAEVLQEVPGVSVLRSGDALSPTKISIRGSRPDQVLVLVDGLRANGITPHPAAGRTQNRQGFDLANLPIARVESIEIIRGAASASHGPDAAAGVVLIRTKRPQNARLVLTQTVGTGDVRETGAEWVHVFAAPPAAQEAHQPATWVLTAHRRSSAGEYLFYDPVAAKSPPPAGSDEPCAPYQGGGLRLRKCNARTIDTLTLTFQRGQHERGQLEWQRSLRKGLGGVLDVRPHGREEEERLQLSYADGFALGGEDVLAFRLNALQLRGARSENDTVPNPALHNAHQDRQLEGELWYGFWQHAQRYRPGLSLHTQHLQDRYFSIRRRRGSAYLLWDWYQPQSTLEASLRQDRYSDLPAHTSARLAASRYLSASLGLKASHGSGYRPPTLYELYDPGTPAGLSVANPHLEPETSLSSDGGGFWEWKDMLYGELLYFEQNVYNDIVAIADPANASLLRLQNVHRTRSRGWESALNLRWEGGWGLDFSWSRTVAIILDNDQNDPRDNGKRVPGIPEQSASLGVFGQAFSQRFRLNLRHAGRRYIDTANSRFLKGYLLVDLSWGWPSLFGFSLQLEGKNLLNTTYAELENHPAPGRQLFLTLRWQRAPPTPQQGDHTLNTELEH